MSVSSRGDGRQSPARGGAPLVHLASLGCVKNLVDSERLLARLGSAGAVVGAPAAEADVIIVNTCGFIAAAREESLRVIGEMARLRRCGPRRKLLVVGCLAQRYGRRLRRECGAAVDGVFGLGEEDAIVAACGLRPPREGDSGRLLLTAPHLAYLRISEGCDNRCAYCAIPLIRGPYRGRSFGEIVREAGQLAAAGARELVVIGQDTTRYADGRRGLPQLLARLGEIPGLRWLRLLYAHPARFDDGLIRAYAELPKLVPYVDLPLQHLNDAILRRMGRKVSQARILDLIARLRERVPGVAIRTTLMVGFPGETRGRFAELLRLARALEFDHLGAFAYSREAGTRAARMPGQVAEEVKAGRLRELMLSQREVARRRNRALVGSEVEVLIESGGAAGLWRGRTAAQAPDVDGITYARGAGLRAGMFARARISGFRGYDLLATVNGGASRRRREASRRAGEQENDEKRQRQND